MIAGAGTQLAVRPLPGTPAGVERLLEVKTRTLHRMFRLRVVARAEDAMREVVVSAAPEPAASAPLGLPEAPEPPRSPDVAHASAPERAEPAAKSPVAASPRRLDLAVHAVVSLGFAALDLAGYESTRGRQFQHALGLRLTGAPRDTWWAVEADVSAAWATGSMEYRAMPDMETLEVTGPWLRAEIGMRARMGVTWMPTAYVGLGFQTHLRRSEKVGQFGLQAADTMKDGAVLVLGMGLQRRARDFLLGLDFQMRQGGPDDYRSVAALWTVGYFLDRGE
jgi:hypothetical protein